MVTKKIALILIGCSSLVQASNNDMRNLLIGTAAVTAATTGGILVWRHLTHGQDKDVIGNVDKKLSKFAKYSAANSAIDQCGTRVEATIIDITSIIAPLEHAEIAPLENAEIAPLENAELNPSRSIASIGNEIYQDLDLVTDLRSETLRSWDFWVRSWFNSDFNSSIGAINKRKEEIENVRKFLVNDHANYFTGTSLVEKSKSLVSSINPDYLNLTMDNKRLMKSDAMKDRLSEFIKNSNVFYGAPRPLYFCNERLSDKKIEIGQLLLQQSSGQSQFSQYPQLKENLKTVQVPLILLSAAIQEMSKYKEEANELAAIRKGKAEERRKEQAHQARLKIAEAQVKVAEAQVKVAEAAQVKARAEEIQAKAHQQEADTNRKRLSVEERNAAIRRRAHDKGITEAQAQKELKSEDAWNFLAGAAIVGVASLFQ